MDEATGWCQGCLRTLDEIAGWGGLDDGGKRIVLRRLGGRRVAWRAARQAAPVEPLPAAAAGEPGP
jgi:hypothetical protein